MPVLEQLSDEEDIDNMDFDPSQFDENNPFDKRIPVVGAANLRPVERQPRAPEPVPVRAEPVQAQQMPQVFSESPQHTKSWSVLYPVYFDADRSVAQGRRVPQSLAVPNPLALRVAEACRSLGIESHLELVKTHPRDWANPGRVRVNCRGSKRALYARICTFLQQNPATEATAGAQIYQQIGPFDAPRPLAVPRGMRLGKLVPGISRAASAEKSLKETMSREMGEMGGMGGMGRMFGM